MLSLDYIKENIKEVKEGIKNKGGNPSVVDRVLELASNKGAAMAEADKIRSHRNEVSKKLGNKDLTEEERKAFLQEAERVKRRLQETEKKMAVFKELDALVLSLPNIPARGVPIGADESANKIVRKVGKPPKFKFEPKNYLELANWHDLIDIERASKVSGSRFGYLKNEAVLLEFALVRFVLDELQKEGFTPIVPPVMIKHDVMRKLGYLEKDPEDIYYLEKDDMNLIGTAEHSIVPMFMDETLELGELPRRFAGFSTAFRREAGSYGRDTRGILRVHQFDKVEMVSFTAPKDSIKEHKLLLSFQERLMKALEIPYQVIHISTGDMGFVAADQYDIESWIPSERKYRETHSTSNTTDFQARRLNMRYQHGGKREFVHILNGTAFAIGRTLIALLENHQAQDGSVAIPQALYKYTGFKKIGK
ncbi:MAG: serine--tRNA ligase [Candidatus Spechtbacteria bacterium RIFCSPLOWO2_01_FULL_46_10]|uniref:Serine--tRNA ligase n=1 Tax=Candidatus Spechtbacteria bacterium RIFCSPLOWO2_01_FULL_46_10 TaxID=1802163 RepID=A0A1G2HGR6_9BACT|nr:MAG: serine--tRNA ligase [Candidatus Spechtbacteria bacterium RIFCSPLOWO2_01_FULL_46_10]